MEERGLDHVLGFVMVVQFALDESDEPGPVVPIQPLDLGGHTPTVASNRAQQNEVAVAGRVCGL
jgi:hypothetical protein